MMKTMEAKLIKEVTIADMDLDGARDRRMGSGFNHYHRAPALLTLVRYRSYTSVPVNKIKFDS